MRASRPVPIILAGLTLSCGGGRFLCKMPVSEDIQPLQVRAQALSVTLEPASHEVKILDSLFYEGTFTRFELHAGLELSGLSVGGKRIPLKRLVSRPSEDSSRVVHLLTCASKPGGVAVIEARGRLWQDPANVRFGHEKVGGELSATVGEEGAWFSSECALWPVAGEEGALTPHRVHADLPANWSLVTDGRLVREEVQGGRRMMSWDEPLPGPPPALVAGDYDIRREQVDGVELSTWFFRRDPAAGPFEGVSGPVDDAQVRDTLHRMSAYYLRMYTELLGAYPYGKFAVVESFFPSGYGMPGWTLLGSQVIRMPYIPYTSLGHELLHNYWGNGVYVDASRGNWCEGLTVFDADYRYKVLEGPEAARDYRKGLLKEYRAYVDGSRDLPLREFRNRHDGATRSIGYGKSMMVFHMLEKQLGAEAFQRVRKGFYQSFAGKEASWDDFLAACQAEGQVDLAPFAAQWLDRPGAPALALDEVDWEGGRLRGRLRQLQEGPAYQLDVPVRIEAHDGTVLERVVLMDGAEVQLDLPCPEPRRVQVDPDYDIFRLLDGREMEPTVALALAEEAPLFVAPKAWLADAASREALATFARALCEVDEPEWTAQEELPAGPLQRGMVVLNASTLPAGLEAVELARTVQGWTLAGQSGDWATRSLVVAAKSAANDRKGALMIWVPGLDALPALARKVPHYGKYSYLAFDGAGVNVLKGNLAPKGNPLERRFGSW